MIQYKLISEYPGSPEIGTIHTYNAGDLGSDSNYEWRGTNFYDAHPKFWQKVEEQKYEIGKWYRNSVGLFCVTKVENYIVYAYGFCREIWTDSESFPMQKYQEDDVLACDEEIEKALICEAKKRGYKNGCFVLPLWETPRDSWALLGNRFEYRGECLYLSSCIFKDGKWAEIIEQKQPLFTTEDGVEIFESNTYWSVTDDFKLLVTHSARILDYKIRAFSTKEKAEEWILYNKSVLSLNDLLSTWGNADNPKHTPLFRRFESIAKSKL